MADTKITALTALTAADPANDVIPIVDVSDTTMAASGTTKKISVNNILGASGTATLASATITGALTVDTTTLVVDATNNRVGIGTASPESQLDVRGLITVRGTPTFPSTGVGLEAYYSSANTSTFLQSYDRGGSAFANLSYNALSHIFQLSSGTAMTLNSNGLGVGVTPSAWGVAFKAAQLTYGSLYSQAFTVAGVAANCYNAGAGGWTYFGSGQLASRYEQSVGTHAWYTAPSGTAGNAITFSQAMTLDSSGNLLLGKTANSIITAGFQSTSTGEVSAALAASTNASTQWTTYSTGAAAYRFYVGMGGTVFATNTTISAISDSRLKENVQDLDVGLNAILALKPRKFDWKAGKGKDIKGDRGFIAQEFETVFPNLIDEWKDAAPEGEAPYKSVRADLIPVLVKAIQELTARVQTLEAK